MYLLYCPPNYKLLKWNCWKFWSREMKYHHSSVVESKSFHHSWLGFASSLVMKWFWFNSRLVMIFHFSTPEFSAIVHFMQPQIPRNCSKNTDNIMPKTAHFTIFFKCKISPQIFCGKKFHSRFSTSAEMGKFQHV